MKKRVNYIEILFFLWLQDKILYFILEIIRNQTMNFIQECDIHLKKCIHFIETLADLQKDSTQTSKNKLEQLKVKLFLFSSFIFEIHFYRLNILKF